MSKTWRGEERFRRKSEAREEECLLPAAPPCEPERPQKVTAEWAVRRMSDHVRYELERMVAHKLITSADKEDYTLRINRRIEKAVPAYSRDVCKYKPGCRAASPVHFFTVVVDNELMTIRRFIERLCRSADEKPISFQPPDVAEKHGYVSVEALSDQCRTIRDLEFRMDVETLRGMMTCRELEIFDLRMAEYTYPEIAEKIGMSRYALMRFMKKIQAKARVCGFVPRAEARNIEKSPHYFRLDGL